MLRLTVVPMKRAMQGGPAIVAFSAYVRVRAALQ